MPAQTASCRVNSRWNAGASLIRAETERAGVVHRDHLVGQSVPKIEVVAHTLPRLLPRQ